MKLILIYIGSEIVNRIRPINQWIKVYDTSQLHRVYVTGEGKIIVEELRRIPKRGCFSAGKASYFYNYIKP
jgi:hypothetical protein